MAKKSKDNGQISQFGTKESIKTPSNTTESAIMGGLEAKLDIFINDMSSAMLSLITGDKTSIKSGQILSHINQNNNLFNKVNQINLKFDNLNNQISSFSNKFDNIFNKYDNQTAILEQFLINFNEFVNGFTSASYVRDDLISQIIDGLNFDNDVNPQNMTLISDEETKKYLNQIIKEIKNIKLDAGFKDLNSLNENINKLSETLNKSQDIIHIIENIDKTGNQLNSSINDLNDILKNIKSGDLQKIMINLPDDDKLYNILQDIKDNLTKNKSIDLSDINK